MVWSQTPCLYRPAVGGAKREATVSQSSSNGKGVVPQQMILEGNDSYLQAWIRRHFELFLISLDEGGRSERG